jgi:hypothetical protein
MAASFGCVCYHVLLLMPDCAACCYLLLLLLRLQPLLLLLNSLCAASLRVYAWRVLWMERMLG